MNNKTKKNSKKKKSPEKSRKYKFTLNSNSSHNGNLPINYYSTYLIQKALLYKLNSKYNCNKEKYNTYIINNLLFDTNCKIVSIFKEGMIKDYIDEFFHREYNISECIERIPKFYNYYKNYLLFFCKPIFKDFKYNQIVQVNGEKKAELYYKKNYLKSKSIDNDKDVGFEKTDSEISSENNSKNKNDGLIFNDTIKEKLENVTILTTTDDNKSINLNVDNERLEVFCENKYDKSNDTTIIDFINNYKKEMDNRNHRNSMKNNHSYILGNKNFSRNKYKSKINITSYKILLNDNIYNSQNKLIKKKNIKKNSSKKAEIKDETNNRKISVEKVKNYIKAYFTNLKEKKLNKELINNKKEKSKQKTNISLKMIHKGYYKLENELKNLLINYRKNIKDKYNQISITTTFSNTPYNYKLNKKSRNTNNNILYKQSSILTGINGYGATTTQNKIKSSNYNNYNNFNFSQKSYNLSCSNINAKNKKNIKYIINGTNTINKNNNGNGKNSLNKRNKINNNISIKIENENENKKLNNKNSKSNKHKDINYNNYYNSNKIYHTKNLIKIKKCDKLLKKKNGSKKPVILEIKNNNTLQRLNKINNNNSKETIHNININSNNINLKMNK